jgi:hypothetical protein
MRTRPSHFVLGLVLSIALVTSSAQPAAAGGRVFTHGLNTVFASPFEFIVSPYVAGDTLFHNMEAEGFSPTTKALFTVPGYCWLWMIQVGLASGRAFGGVAEIPYGLALAFTPWDPNPILDIEREHALFKRDTATGPFMFGIYLSRR